MSFCLGGGGAFPGWQLSMGYPNSSHAVNTRGYDRYAAGLPERDFCMPSCIPGEIPVCIVISVADDLPKIAIWDPDEVSILVARGTATGELIREVAAILTIDLGAPASVDDRLVCFCGTLVQLPGELTALVAAVDSSCGPV